MLFGMLLGLLTIPFPALSRTSPGGVLLAALLVWPTVSFLAAPYNSLSAQHAALPPELRERRRTEYLRYGTRRLTFAVGGLGLAGGTAALALGLFVPGTANIVALAARAGRGQPVHLRPGERRRASANAPGSTGNTLRLGPGEEIEGFEHDEHEHHVGDHDLLDIRTSTQLDDVDGHLDDDSTATSTSPTHHFIHDRDGPPTSTTTRVDHDARADEHHVGDAAT